jgi:hypothetical protein
MIFSMIGSIIFQRIFLSNLLSSNWSDFFRGQLSGPYKAEVASVEQEQPSLGFLTATIASV